MFSDHDNQTNAAAAAPAPESETVPNNAHTETNSTVESAAEQTALPAATQAAEVASATPETPAAGTPEQSGVSTDSASAHAAAEANRETHAADAESAAADEEAAGSEEMSKLLQEYDEKQEAAASHEVIEVKVVAYTEHGVVVDLGGKTEGLIPAAEFTDTEIPRPEPNSTIEVQRTGEHKDGFTILSYLKVLRRRTWELRRRTWEKIEAAFKAKETITGKVVDRIKGGIVVDIGVRAFLPGSQYDLRPAQNLDNLTGTEIKVRVTKLNRRRGNVVVSRRALLEEELHAKRAALMETLSEGQVVHGHVKNVTEYGAFVDLGGIDGLLHLTDLSWGRVKHPSDVVKPDQEVDVIILKFDKEKQRVSLGMKQLMADPWVGAAEKYPAGGKVKGKIVGIVDYGVFVELEQGIEGLVHVSEMSWNKKIQHPSKVAKVGDEVDVVVLDIKPSDRRVSLGIKQAQPDPWLLIAEKYPVGTVVTGKVRNIAEFGAFIEIEDGFDGLVHVSDVSWTERIKNPVGQIVKGKVSRIATFGAFVELGENIEALCHNTEIEERKRRDEGHSAFRPTTGPLKSAGPLEPGKEYDFKIIKISPETRRIGLSYRAAVKQIERKEIEQYRSTSKSSSTATIGDALKSKLSAR